MHSFKKRRPARRHVALVALVALVTSVCAATAVAASPAGSVTNYLK
jgi:hypothetical protein